MSPHDSNPTPRTIDVDVSEILIHPRLPEAVPPGAKPKADLTSLDQPKRPIGPRDFWIGPFGWVSINFVVGSCLIAVFCTLFLSENVQYFRRRSRLADEILYAKPEIDSTGSQNFGLEPSKTVSNLQLDRSPVIAPKGGESDSNGMPNPAFSSFTPPREAQTPSLPSNLGRLADNGSAINNASSADPGTGGRDSVSRSTSSSTETSTSTSKSRSRSVRASVTGMTTSRAMRHSRNQTASVQPGSLNGRRSLRQSMTRTAAAKSGMGKSVSQTSGVLKLGNQQSQHDLSQTQIGAARNQMSMHGMGQGSVGAQMQGGINPMRMEGGSLAQPVMGGVTGGGLGGGGSARHGGQGRR